MPLPHSGDKDLEKIQQIVKSTKVANLAKRAVRTIADFALVTKKRQPERVIIKSKLGEKCFNCEKKSHYAKNCHSSISNKRISVEKLTEETKRF